jgi:A/G-specific adenine glycosylase
MPKLLRDLKSFWRTSKREHLPWRETRDPYKILVSEIMLQQTQVERVIPFYEKFIKEFPTPAALAKAPLSKVLSLWSGLGYNRRAKFLHAAAKKLSVEFPRSGEMNGSPTPAREISTESLEGLPGVGPYTARAVAATTGITIGRLLVFSKRKRATASVTLFLT